MFEKLKYTATKNDIQSNNASNQTVNLPHNTYFTEMSTFLHNYHIACDQYTTITETILQKQKNNEYELNTAINIIEGETVKFKNYVSYLKVINVPNYLKNLHDFYSNVQLRSLAMTAIVYFARMEGTGVSENIVSEVSNLLKSNYECLRQFLQLGIISSEQFQRYTKNMSF